MEENKILARIVQNAVRYALDGKYEFITPEILFLSSLKNIYVYEVLSGLGCEIDFLEEKLQDYIKENVSVIEKSDSGENSFAYLYENENENESENDTPIVSVLMNENYQNAEYIATCADRKEFDIFDVILSFYEDERLFVSYLLKRSGVEKINLLEAIADFRREKIENQNENESQNDANHEFFSESDEDEDKDENKNHQKISKNPKNILENFTTNLTQKAKNGEFDKLIGREQEIDRTIHILCRRTKNNPIHVGDAGVGKTALAEGLAQKIAEGKVPERLQNYEIYSLEMSTLVAGTKFRGDFEKRMKMIIDALLQKNRAILYIDEIHTIVGAGASGSGNLDVANIIKPILAGGDVRVMGATTYEEYSKLIEKNRALARRFQKVDVPEPSIEETVKILKGISSKYEEYHKVSYPEKSLKLAIDLSVQYLPDRRLPDKAIDIMDESGVYVSLQNEKKKSPVQLPKVTENVVKKVTAKISNVPLENVNEDEKSKLKKLEANLQSQIFGQDEAVHFVSLAVKKARAGFRNLEKPEASFLFVGPTGVGKTELTKVLSEILGENLLRFDMSEYQEQYTVSRLIGSAPGYVGYENGGQLTESVRKNPHSIILFDEIEKAHEDIYNILLQVLDYGTLTDNQGRKSDFRNCIIILTSNAGARDMEKGLVGFDSGINSNKNDEVALKEAVSKAFSPEFRNRLDAIVPFHHLSKDVTKNIAKKAIKKISDRLSSQKVSLEISNSALDFIAKEGYSKEFGARNISRTAENLVATPLVDEVLFGKLCNGGKVNVDLENDKLTFTFDE